MRTHESEVRWNAHAGSVPVSTEPTVYYTLFKASDACDAYIGLRCLDLVWLRMAFTHRVEEVLARKHAHLVRRLVVHLHERHIYVMVLHGLQTCHVPAHVNQHAI